MYEGLLTALGALARYGCSIMTLSLILRLGQIKITHRLYQRLCMHTWRSPAAGINILLDQLFFLSIRMMPHAFIPFNIFFHVTIVSTDLKRRARPS